MRRELRSKALLALWCALFFGGLAIPGCSGQQRETGTVVQRTLEQEAAEKASMEGMRNAMKKAQNQRQGQAR
jgi:hypothetical protein